MSPGDNISRRPPALAMAALINQFSQELRQGSSWHTNWADATKPDSFKARHQRPAPGRLFVESIANPGGIITDIEAVAKIACA